MSTRNTIERFIVDDIMIGERGTKLESEQSLIQSGILDSLSLLRLIRFLEEEFQIVVEDGELIPDNFETIERVAEFVEARRSG
jgi:acyl carrier protein